MYKLLALDIDETLLDSNGELSEENRRAIQRAQKAGVIVTVATGRSYEGTEKLCKIMGLDALPIITFGGAVIKQYPEQDTLYKSLMPESLVRQCIDFARRNNVYIQCYDGDSFYYQTACEESAFYETRLGYKGQTVDMDRYHFNNSPKCLICAQPFIIDKLLPIAKSSFEGKATVLRSYSRFLEFYNPGVNKGSALQWLGSHLLIAQEEMIAIGDSDLDIPMIQYAGLGVAVRNASTDVMNAANYVAPHADENAVAHVINKFILQN